MKLSKAFLVAVSSVELLTFPFTGPLFIFTLYLIASLSFIYSICVNRRSFVLLYALPMFLSLIVTGDRSRIIINTICVYIPWSIAITLACLPRHSFPNKEAESCGYVKKAFTYIFAIVPFIVATLFICMLP